MTTNLSTYHQPINLRNITWKYTQRSPKQIDLMIDVLLLYLWVFEIILSKSVVNQITHMIWDGSKCACLHLRAPTTYFEIKTQVEKNLFIIRNIYVVHHVLGCRKYLLTKYIFSCKKRRERYIYIFPIPPTCVPLSYRRF